MLKRKLGQVTGKTEQTVQKTKSTENLHLWILSAERSPHIIVLNVETEPRMGDGEN